MKLEFFMTRTCFYQSSCAWSNTFIYSNDSVILWNIFFLQCHLVKLVSFLINVSCGDHVANHLHLILFTIFSCSDGFLKQDNVTLHCVQMIKLVSGTQLISTYSTGEPMTTKFHAATLNKKLMHSAGVGSNLC